MDETKQIMMKIAMANLQQSKLANVAQILEDAAHSGVVYPNFKGLGLKTRAGLPKVRPTEAEILGSHTDRLANITDKLEGRSATVHPLSMRGQLTTDRLNAIKINPTDSY